MWSEEEQIEISFEGESKMENGSGKSKKGELIHGCAAAGTVPSTNQERSFALIGPRLGRSLQSGLDRVGSLDPTRVANR